MYGLPKDFDPTVFVGLTVERIVFTVNTATVEFSRDVMVNLVASFEYRNGTTGAEEQQSVPVTESGSMRVIGQNVIRADASADGTLTLTFENGDSLSFIDDSQQYESYVISIEGKEIIV